MKPPKKWTDLSLIIFVVLHKKIEVPDKSFYNVQYFGFAVMQK